MMLIYFRPDLAIRNSLQSQISFEAGLLKISLSPFVGCKYAKNVCHLYIYIYIHTYIHTYIDIHIHASGISIYLSPVTRWKLLVGNLSSSPHLPVPLDKLEPAVHHYLIFGALPGTLVPNIGNWKTFRCSPGRVARPHRQHGELDPLCHFTSLGGLRLLQLGRVFVRYSWIML